MITKTYAQTNTVARSPTLQTVLMVEKFIDEHSGEYKKTELFHSLPKKVMWQTYLIILDYLQGINKIAISKEGILVYIWSQEITKKFMQRKRY